MDSEIKSKTVDLLDKGYIELQDIMGNDLSIVNAARVSYLGESKGEEQDQKLLNYLMKNKHTSPFEMVRFKFRIKCPLFVARQWQRHRTWHYMSVNEVSRRYTSEEIEFYLPEQWRLQHQSSKQASEGFADEEMQIFCKESLDEVVNHAVTVYNYMIDKGIAREQARMLLPQNIYTIFIANVDAHNLLHFLSLRRHAHAQYEIRVYADAIWEQFFKPLLPWTAEAAEKYLFVDSIDG